MQLSECGVAHLPYPREKGVRETTSAEVFQPNLQLAMDFSHRTVVEKGFCQLPSPLLCPLPASSVVLPFLILSPDWLIQF